MTMKTNKKIIFSIILVMGLWAICYPLIVLGLDDAPHITFAALRASIAGATLLLLGAILGKEQPKILKHWFYLLVIGLGATTVGFYGMFHASEFVSPGMATVLTNLQPMLTAVLAFWFLKESINKFENMAIIMGFAGVMIIAASNEDGASGVSFEGLTYLIIAVIGLSVSNVLIKQLAGKVNALVAMGWQLIFGAIVLWILAFTTENQTEINWSTNFIISLLALSLFGTALAYWLWFKVLETVDLVFANSFSFLVPAFGILMGVFIFKESFTVQVAIGITVIFIGIVLINLPKNGEGKNA